MLFLFIFTVVLVEGLLVLRLKKLNWLIISKGKVETFIFRNGSER